MSYHHEHDRSLCAPVVFCCVWKRDVDGESWLMCCEPAVQSNINDEKSHTTVCIEHRRVWPPNLN